MCRHKLSKVWILIELAADILFKGTHDKMSPARTCITQFWVLEEHALWGGRKVMGSLLPESSVLTHSLRCLNLTFNSWDDSGQILLEVKSMHTEFLKRWEIAEICNDKADEEIDEMVVAIVRASKIAYKWFIPVAAKPIDNSRVLIKYQPLGKYSNIFWLCVCILVLLSRGQIIFQYYSF